MRIPAGLLLAVSGGTLVIAACSGGSSGTGYVTGTVLAESPGTGPVASAAIAIGASNTASAADGSFSMNVDSGKHALDVVKSGFHELHSEVTVAGGENTLHLRLVPCAPVDIACPSPTPTGTTTPTPLPTPANANVRATFDGINPVLSGGPYPNWVGHADIMGVTTRAIGDNVPGNSDSITECYLVGGVPTSMGDLRTDIDFCEFRFFGFDEAVIDPPPSPSPDALFRIIVRDDLLWQDDLVLTLAAGSVEATYYEGIMQGGGTGGFTFSDQFPATAGVFRLDVAGYYNPQPVTITTGAFFVPGLP